MIAVVFDVVFGDVVCKSEVVGDSGRDLRESGIRKKVVVDLVAKVYQPCFKQRQKKEWWLKVVSERGECEMVGKAADDVVKEW
jgi:hypothetical protein